MSAFISRLHPAPLSMIITPLVIKQMQIKPSEVEVNIKDRNIILKSSF